MQTMRDSNIRGASGDETASPPPVFRWRAVLLPAVMAVVGMLVAWAAVTAGQDARRGREQLQMNYDRYYWEAELAQAKLAGKPAAEIAKIEKIVQQKRAARMIS